MKTLTNPKLIQTRIKRLAATAPAAPLKGLGNIRHELEMPTVFEMLEKAIPAHCVRISERQAINRFGKIGYPKHDFVSPELWEIIQANRDDFANLEAAHATIEQVKI